MNSVVVSLSVALALTVVLLFLGLGKPEGPPADEPTAADQELMALRRELADVREGNASLERRLANLESALASRKSRSPNAEPATEAEEKVQSEASAVTQAETQQQDADSDATLEDALEILLDDDAASFLDKQGAWNNLAQAGLIDQAITSFEELAEENPEDPDLQADLGHAYMRKALTLTNHFERGKWATQADRSFDQALELNDQHWDARFSKAASLGYWPAVYGRQQEAIQHFEILLKQQEGLAPQEHFAQTYLFLGNLHQGRNDMANARKAWTSGAQLFPQNGELQKRVEALTAAR